MHRSTGPDRGLVLSSEAAPVGVTNPGAGYQAHREEIDEAIARVLRSGWYILGDEVSRFEEEFAAFLSVDHAIGVGSGTDALHLALRALGIGPGDTVITVSHTAVATVAAIELAGASPLLVDVDARTFTMDVEHLKATVKSLASRPGTRIKAIVPVHLYGQCADLPAILGIARDNGLAVVEDCAQAHGARLDGKMAGAWGDIAAFSFYPTKNLAAFGDGGAVATRSAELAERVRLLREYGWRERPFSEVAGMNSRLDELQAAVLRVRLRHLDAENAQRVRIAQAYREELVRGRIEPPFVARKDSHVYHQFVLKCDVRDHLRDALSGAGVGTLIHYPVPVHMQPAYRGRVAIAPGGLPVTETVCGQVLSLPMHPFLPIDSAHRIAQLVNQCV